MEWMILPFKRFFEMSGRSCRREYWMFTLFSLLAGIAAAVVDYVIGFGSEDNGPVGIVTSLAFFVPGITVLVRRLHDIDRSAWWCLLVFVPILGWIALLVFLCTDGTNGSNRFGPDPKDPTRDLGAVFS